jgi:hypothetical protein
MVAPKIRWKAPKEMTLPGRAIDRNFADPEDQILTRVCDLQGFGSRQAGLELSQTARSFARKDLISPGGHPGIIRSWLHSLSAQEEQAHEPS